MKTVFHKLSLLLETFIKPFHLTIIMISTRVTKEILLSWSVTAKQMESKDGSETEILKATSLLFPRMPYATCHVATLHDHGHAPTFERFINAQLQN